jgi:hypothetical protein
MGEHDPRIFSEPPPDHAVAPPSHPIKVPIDGLLLSVRTENRELSLTKNNPMAATAIRRFLAVGTA